MALWKALCLFFVFTSHAGNTKYFVHGQEKTEESFRNTFEPSKSRTVSDLEKLLQYVSEVDKKFQSKSGCNDVAILDMIFDSTRWHKEALFAVEIANLLTSLWQLKAIDGFSVIENDTVLFEIVRANVRFSPFVFGSVVCFEPTLYRGYDRFCPYAFKDSKLNDSTHLVDLAKIDDYDYSTSPNAVWWKDIRDKTRDKKPAGRKKMTDFCSTGQANRSTPHGLSRTLVELEDGLWTRPYFDCLGGKTWMITYLAPILNETDEFL